MTLPSRPVMMVRMTDPQDEREAAFRERQEQTSSSAIKLAISAVVVLAVTVGGLFAWRAYEDSQKTADIPAIEQEIVEGMKDQAGVDVTVDCPSSVDWKVGGEFHCVVEADDGSRATATVSMENEAGDVTWRTE